jgi:hypothetical protein
VLIDGHSIEPRSGHDKITYECACLGKETEDIVWGFVLCPEDRETPPTPKPRDSPPPPIQRIAPPRVKVVMQRQKTQGGASSTRVEASESPPPSPFDSPPLSPFDSQGQNIEPLEKWYRFEEENDKILPSLFGQSNSSFVVLNAN